MNMLRRLFLGYLALIGLLANLIVVALLAFWAVNKFADPDTNRDPSQANSDLSQPSSTGVESNVIATAGCS